MINMSYTISDDITREQVAEAYYNSLGNMTRTAERLNVSRRALINWRDRDDELREMLEDTEEALRDRLEATAFERAIKEDGGSDRLLIYLLDKKCVKRWEVERTRYVPTDWRI